MATLSPFLVPGLTITISVAAAVISYYNYRLKKTLNIKNQLFNEKLKKYIELSRKLAEFIELLDVAGPTLNQSQHDHSVRELLLEQAEKANRLGQEIEYLVIDAHMLVPGKIISQLMDFVTTQNMGGTGELSKMDRVSYWKNEELFRKKAERLIRAFREDLHVEKLSFSMPSKTTRRDG
ncbi:hypothetical protein EZ449_20970 [Pedobacter frigidisoli]|uniref:Uncharacterized protein n=1 Tax=Pedobacter frigidisoli TaxID=2530455 RepID=A0A4R0NJ73_9SPHI|nr:hypothetical protein [Pedobacter frigidisoli]TCD00269.1 hypothetical protein EZ449_20970 [Pedobacter frigidisoli]